MKINLPHAFVERGRGRSSRWLRIEELQGCSRIEGIQATGVHHTASWEPNHPNPIFGKNCSNPLGWIFIYLWVVSFCGFNIGIDFLSYLIATARNVRPKMRLYKWAIFWPKKWLFCNSDTTFTLTEFSRLHFVQISRKDSSAPNWAKSRFVDFG